MKTLYYRYSAKTDPDTDVVGVGALFFADPESEAKSNGALLEEFHSGGLILEPTGDISFGVGSIVGKFTAQHDPSTLFCEDDMVGIGIFVDGIYDTEADAKWQNYMARTDDLTKACAAMARDAELTGEPIRFTNAQRRALKRALKQSTRILRKLERHKETPPDAEPQG